VQDERVELELGGTAHLVGERGARGEQRRAVRRREVDEVGGMCHDPLDDARFALSAKRCRNCVRELRPPPLRGTLDEDLEGRSADRLGAREGLADASGGRDVGAEERHTGGLRRSATLADRHYRGVLTSTRFE
jgi:hypothetical protein